MVASVAAVEAVVSVVVIAEILLMVIEEVNTIFYRSRLS